MPKKTTKKPAKKRQHKVGRRRALPHNVDLAIIYPGGIDRDLDRAILAVVGKYDTGSGVAFINDGARDITATVPDEELSRVLSALKKIPRIKIKKRVTEWVVV
jgi:hypothetical protein